MPAELTGGAGAQDYVEQRLQRTRQRVLTDENVKSLIERYTLYEIGVRVGGPRREARGIQRQRVDHAASDGRHRSQIDARGRADLRIRRRLPAFRSGNRPRRSRTNSRICSSPPARPRRRKMPSAKSHSPRPNPSGSPLNCASARPAWPHSGRSIPAACRMTACATRNARCSTSATAPWSIRTSGRRVHARNLYTAQLRDTPRDSAGHRRNRPGRAARRRPAGGWRSRNLSPRGRSTATITRTSQRLRREIAPVDLPKSPGARRAHRPIPLHPAPVAGQRGGHRSPRARRRGEPRSRPQLSSAQGAVSLSPRARGTVHGPGARLRGHQDPVRADARAAGDGGAAEARSPAARPPKPTCSSIRRAFRRIRSNRTAWR